MKKTELEKWYEPLEPHFNSISDAMPSMRFATIEAVLHLLYINAPEADPQKAYLLFLIKKPIPIGTHGYRI